LAQTKPLIEIVNIVVLAIMDQKLDLLKIQEKFPDVEYHPKKFPGICFRLKNFNTVTLIFSTGKMICVGSKTEEIAEESVKTIIQLLRSKKFKIKNEPIITVQNIVSSINLGGKIDLEKTARSLPRSMYEPEQFPGVFHRMIHPKTVVQVFSTGKLICTGAKKESDVYQSINNMHSLLEEKDLILYN